ncbi:unnamed protein product [Paramecium octaurelia]|uniref:Uncharacterized protein n=1 Tax=Paramecium octaurelia TaxID=43137 RepID=A0A8S1W986_PAROT|nr:unnamed protein product [Paramecium octaurelia]
MQILQSPKPQQWQMSNSHIIYFQWISCDFFEDSKDANFCRLKVQKIAFVEQLLPFIKALTLQIQVSDYIHLFIIFQDFAQDYFRFFFDLSSDYEKLQMIQLYGLQEIRTRVTQILMTKFQSKFSSNTDKCIYEAKLVQLNKI